MFNETEVISLNFLSPSCVDMSKKKKKVLRGILVFFFFFFSLKFGKLIEDTSMQKLAFR
jgi:hypothetical protein